MDHSTVARFWSKVNPNGPPPVRKPEMGPCWLWHHADGDSVYGYFWYEGKKRLAHRFSFQMFVGEIPEDLTIDHLCKTTLCIRPDHLEPVPGDINILRGDGPAARNAVATTCWRGHPFDAENTYWYPNGDRGCRICIREYGANYRAQHSKGTGKGWHKLITHCPAGHEYTPENTYVGPDGGRDCRTCVRIRNREAQRRRRAAERAIRQGYVPLEPGTTTCPEGHDLSGDGSFTYRGQVICVACTSDGGRP